LSGFLKPVDDIYISSFTGKPIAAATYYDAQKQRNREPAAVRSTQQADMKVNGMGRAGWLTSLVIARWAMDGLVHEVSLGDDTARDRLAAEVSVSSYNAVIDGKSKARIANVYRNTLGLDALIIAAFCLLFLVLTVGALYYREAL